jgi:hypothetical protein
MRRYLQAITALRGAPLPGYKYNSFEAYVLAQGQPYPSASIPAARKKQILEHIKTHRMRFPIKQCYANCLEFVLTAPLPGVTYVEGFATGYLLPIHHAWLSVDGMVFDPTLRLKHKPELTRDSLATNRIWGGLGEREYIGVEFADTQMLARRAVETELLQSVIDDWQNDWPALKGAYDNNTNKPLR